MFFVARSEYAKETFYGEFNSKEDFVKAVEEYLNAKSSEDYFTTLVEKTEDEFSYIINDVFLDDNSNLTDEKMTADFLVIFKPTNFTGELKVV